MDKAVGLCATTASTTYLPLFERIPLVESPNMARKICASVELDASHVVVPGEHTLYPGSHHSRPILSGFLRLPDM